MRIGTDENSGTGTALLNREIPGLHIRKIGFISVNGFEEKEEGYSCYEGKDLYR